MVSGVRDDGADRAEAQARGTAAAALQDAQHEAVAAALEREAQHAGEDSRASLSLRKQHREATRLLAASCSRRRL